MKVLLQISRAIDWFNHGLGRICNGLVMLACLVSAVNAMIRYAFDSSSNAWLEAQWYMFALIVMFGAGYTLQRNEHVRVDIFYMQLSERGRHWLEILGGIVFLLPACLLFAWLSWPFFAQSFAIGERSSNAGGLLRWPIKFVLPGGFTLLALQGISEIIKHSAALRGYVVVDSKYERPIQ